MLKNKKYINERKLKKTIKKYSRSKVKIEADTLLTEDLMIDSLSFIALVSDIETEFDIYLSETDLINASIITYSMLVDIIRDKKEEENVGGKQIF